MGQTRRFTFWHGVGVSLLLHACAILPAVLWVTCTPHKHSQSMNRLNIELFGMLSNRQTVARVKRIESTQPTPTASQKQKDPAPKNEITPAEAVVRTDLHTTLNNSQNDLSNSVRLPSTPSTFRENSQVTSGPARQGGDSNQMQQFLGHRVTEADLINAYIRQLTKQAKDHLIYPLEAKRKRLEGISEVSFVVTESGTIKSNTLKITRSSGSTILDASALETITRIAPFQRPPHQLTVSFGIDFAVDR